MSENINYAFPEQNKEEFIKLLKAQRYYYKVAKRWQMSRFLMSILIPILFVIAKLKFLNEFEAYKAFFAWIDLSWIVSVSLLWMALSLIFKHFEKKYISIGASIQEKFDTKVFGIEKNKICFFKEPTPEEISHGAKKFKGNTEKLKDWYTVPDCKNKFRNTLLAQRTNLIWTENLKSKYKYIFLLLIGFIVIIEIFISALINPSFIEAMTTLFLSSIPIFVFIYEYYTELNRQIENHKIVNQKILNVFNNLHTYTDSQLSVMTRQFQDYIYEKSRLNSLLVPEFLYKLLREKDEGTMRNVNQSLANNFVGNKKNGINK